LWAAWLPAPDGGARPDESTEDGLNGRVDLRERFPRAYAIDAQQTDFRDDAVSWCTSSTTLVVHIIDLDPVVCAGSPLDEVARLRLQTLYDGAMPLHMLPPSLLREASLSSKLPNECVSALLQLDAFGRVRHARLVRSLVPPVRTLTFAEVDALLDDKSVSSQIHAELRALASMAKRRVMARDPAGRGGPAVVRWTRQRGDAPWQPELVPKTPARCLVDEALSLYSYAARGAGKRNNLLRLPQSENHRIATAPLRRYVFRERACYMLSDL
jgi:hypothetical protein